MDIESGRDRILKDLTPLNKHIRKTLDKSIGQVIDYFVQKDREVDFNAVPDMVRMEVIDFLKKHPLSNMPYRLEKLPRNGLSVIVPGYYYKFYTAKILMSSHLPIAGSRERDRFYKQESQQPSLFSQLADAFQYLPSKEIRKDSLCLVYLWQITNVVKGSFDLKLVCTKKGKGNRAIIEWEIPIRDITDDVQLPDIALTNGMDDLGLSLPERLEKKQGEEQFSLPTDDVSDEDDLGLSPLDNTREDSDNTETDG